MSKPWVVSRLVPCGNRLNNRDFNSYLNEIKGGLSLF